MTKYKAVIFDVDRTLTISNDLRVTQKVIDSIKKAEKIIHVGIATSRSRREIKNIFKTVPLNSPSIVSGGAQIINSKSHVPYYERVLSANILNEIQKIAQEDDVLISVDNDGELVPFGNSLEYAKPFAVFTTTPLQQSKAEQFALNLSKISNVDIRLAAGYEENFSWVMITHPEATKQHGVIEVAKLLDIQPSEMIGVGDSYNDLPLLSACGLKVAMGNAAPELKKFADYIAPSVEDNGAADVIEKFIL